MASESDLLNRQRCAYELQAFSGDVQCHLVDELELKIKYLEELAEYRRYWRDVALRRLAFARARLAKNGLPTH